MSRALRVMLVANDGLSTGHVTRMLAIAHALDRRAARRAIEVQRVLVTTSEAASLLADQPLATVRLPTPSAARRAGLSDAERRRLVRGAIDGIVDSYAPDLVAVDTFPSGPHGELAHLGRRVPRVLVRRAVPSERLGDPVLADGLDDHALAILAGDPVRIAMPLAIPARHVPPITLELPARSRPDARAVLGLPPDARTILVASGGGGDRDAVERAEAIARSIVEVSDAIAVVALGPLAPEVRVEHPRIAVTRIAPLAPLHAAFDGAIAAAGYNTAHELARARVPTALFAQPRPFDDQAARAERFAGAGLATVLEGFDRAAIARALGAMPPPAAIEAGGADRAADALLDVATGVLR